MRSDPRSGRALPVLLLLAVAMAVTLVACRELTVPEQQEPEMIKAYGFVYDAKGMGVGDARVDIRVRPESPDTRFDLRVYTDEQGHFEAWIPNRLVHVEIYPPSGSSVPNYEEDDVQFSEGVVRKFALIGIPFHGRVDAGALEHYLEGANVFFETRVARPSGATDYVSIAASLFSGGTFSILLPQEGAYVALLRNYNERPLYTSWTDSVVVSYGDSIFLEMPLAEIELELTLKGEAIPSGELGSFQCFSLLQRLPYSSSDYVGTSIEGDGNSLRHRVVILPGSPSIEINSNLGYPNWVPYNLEVAPLQGGESFTVELGLYDLRVEVSDPAGNPISAWFSLYSENSGNRRVGGSTDSRPSLFFVNPRIHRLVLDQDSSYRRQEIYFEVQGDTTISIQRLPR